MQVIRRIEELPQLANFPVHQRAAIWADANRRAKRQWQWIAASITCWLLCFAGAWLVHVAFHSLYLTVPTFLVLVAVASIIVGVVTFNLAVRQLALAA